MGHVLIEESRTFEKNPGNSVIIAVAIQDRSGSQVAPGQTVFQVTLLGQIYLPHTCGNEGRSIAPGINDIFTASQGMLEEWKAKSKGVCSQLFTYIGREMRDIYPQQARINASRPENREHTEGTLNVFRRSQLNKSSGDGAFFMGEGKSLLILYANF